ncbi:hypothetical protein BKA70DRAFT_1241736 [Coprinopsis sp. MPI-PUGE-AT-0042]|nr:hypothetical protein BKA70DRAFT_1241736 [Coprinopsis sp. MPI-PUGE-AT-0042]
MEQICIAAALSCRAAQEQQQQGSAAWEVAQDGRDAKLDRGTVSILCFWIRFTFLAKMVWFSFRESAKLFGFSWPTTILHFSGSEMAVGLGNVRDHPEEEPVGGGTGSDEPAYAEVSETPTLASRASLEEDVHTSHNAKLNTTSCEGSRLLRSVWALPPAERTPLEPQRLRDGSRDHHYPDEQASLHPSLSGTPAPKLATPPTPQRATSRTVLFDAAVDLEGGAGGSRGGSRGSNEPVYASIGETPALRSRAPSVDGGRPLRASPVEEEGSGQYPQSTTTSTVDPSDPDYQRPVIPRRPRPSHLRRQSSAASRRSRASVHEHKFFWALPHAVRKPLWAWWDRVMSVLSPKWFRTTLLVWGACWSMSLAYTMFNAFLPKLLETRTTLEPELSSASPKRLEDSLWDVVIFTIGGCPGAILGAYLIKSHPGSTLITVLFCMVFSPWAIRASTVGISLSATALWAVLYSWTQEIFATSALSRAIRNPLWAWPNRVELSQSWVTKDDSAGMWSLALHKQRRVSSGNPWGLSDQVTSWSTLVSSMEHPHDCLLLRGLHYGVEPVDIKATIVGISLSATRWNDGANSGLNPSDEPLNAACVYQRYRLPLCRYLLGHAQGGAERKVWARGWRSSVGLWPRIEYRSSCFTVYLIEFYADCLSLGDRPGYGCLMALVRFRGR